MKTLRVAIVGVGGAGLAHVRYFNQIPGTEVVLLVDPHPEEVKVRMEAQGSRPISVTNSFDNAIENSNIDVISVCTPDITHADYVTRAFEAGKHVICEKPLASTIEQCERMVSAWRKSGKVGGVQHQFRFEPWFAKSAEVAHSGRLGKIFSIRGEYVHNLIKRSRLYHDWRFDHKDSHPLLVGAGVHFLDLFRYLLDSDVTEVSARANHIAFPEYRDADFVECHMAFANGTIGSLTVAIGVNHPIHFPIRLFGTEGSLVNGWLVTENSAEQLEPPPPSLDIKSRAIRAARQSYRELRGRPVLYSSTHVRYDHVSACVDSLTNIIDAIRNATQPLVTMSEAARACEIAVAATLSYREHRTVSVPPSVW